MDDASLLAMEYPDGGKATKVQDIDPARVAIYAAKVPQLQSGAVKGVVVENEYGDIIQHVVHQVGDAAPQPIVIEEACKIMLEDLSPTQCVEYKFAESDQWHLGWMGREGCDGYRSAKFKHWREMIDKPDCEAAFRGLLRTGLVTRLYDSQAMPNAPEDAEKWRVTNEETGKTYELPHPVDKMRIWDAAEEKYVELSAHLDGAPSDEDAPAYWQALLEEQVEKHGQETIDRLLGK
eukprot:TRINITY_DN1047_c0_g3_i1.p1 TRINITY_DN1047_c0_g3~~TRINITY_DN1047_c0_g3_i1.p1  ORF type:complete len:235 (+),score=117.45 TRINITY_DN1047_c0_g3_i1:52-756(+)